MSFLEDVCFANQRTESFGILFLLLFYLCLDKVCSSKERYALPKLSIRQILDNTVAFQS